MAFFHFTKSIAEGRPISLFNHGRHRRDFTYIDDIVDGVIRASDDIARADPAFDTDAPELGTSNAPFRIFNIGNAEPVELLDYVRAIEASLGRQAIIEMAPRQAGDALDTFADVTKIRDAVGYRPTTSVPEGIARFVAWYREHYGV